MNLPERKDIDNCLLADRHGLHKRLRGLKAGKGFDEAARRLQSAIDQSHQVVESRRSVAFEMSFPPELPVSQRLDEIKKTISAHQVTILCGETGSGKSTQLPKICLDLGYGLYGRIGHTQPRRIAARSLASRIASELSTESGSVVGYKIRFRDHVKPETRIKLMTDGILLAEIQQDPWLNQYDVLIIDEAHERSLNIDFMLGYLKQLLPRRPDLKVIITSATIDPERFSQHFNDAPIIMVSGRTFGVDLRYSPAEEEGANERDESMQQAIIDAVDEIAREDRGDVLIFLSGEREIRETAETLRKHRMQITEVLPLYARLSPAEQGKIFRPSGQRRIVLATNVAETSLTVPGIRHVIDAGFARISRYSHRSKVQRLPVERISRASADQRKGRCGRVADGICIRLYSEEDFDARQEFTEPEIQRTNLASVILQMKLLRFGEIEDFPFIDPPDSRLIKDGYRVLEEVGAVDGERRVTRIGKRIARLPVDPRIGRMLLESAHTHCMNELLVIASALSIQDPKHRPQDKQQQADEAHATFTDEQSDFITYVKLWNLLQEQRRHLTRRKFTALCRKLFLSHTRVQEWFDIHHQLRGQMHEMGYKENQAEAGYEEIHKAILSGLLSHIGFRSGGKERDYLGARNSRFFIFPGSGLFKQAPKWVAAAELVETTKLYARTVATVQPEWVEALAGHLIKRSYSEPHWQKRRGQVGAYEKINLYGLTLIPRRRINYGPIDPVESREIFIRSALIDGDFQSRAPFWRHNQEMIANLHDQEAKSRQHDILFDEERLYQFYDDQIPSGIYSTAKFESWLKRASVAKPKLLHALEEDVRRPDIDDVSRYQFPDSLDIHGMKLPLQYRFEPGSDDDGVTLIVPREVLNQVTDERLEWLVPGFLEERIVTMMRGLPKALRRNFVPVPDTARRCLEGLEDNSDSLKLAIARRLEEMSGVHISESDWPHEELPNHLRMNVRVFDENGKLLGESRDLALLKKRYAVGKGSQVSSLPKTGIEKDGIVRWDFGSLEKQISIDRSGIKLKGFPAVVDQGETVAIRILDSEENAGHAHRIGLRKLIMLSLSEQTRYLKKQLPGLDRMRLQYAKAPKSADGESRSDLQDDLVALIIDRTFLEESDIRSGERFEQVVAENRDQLMTIANEVCGLVADVLANYQRIRKSLSKVTAINWLVSIKDMQQQLDELVYQGFVRQVPWEHLQHYSRYLKGLTQRLDKLSHAAIRDQQQMREMAPFNEKWASRYEQMKQRHQHDERLEEFRWSIEELRISLFAQEVKTAYPVSLKRLEKRWKELGL